MIGGYTIGTKTFDALVFGYYDGEQLVYAERLYPHVGMRLALYRLPWFHVTCSELLGTAAVVAWCPA